ncbi:hypothetical protein FKW77_006109 [Venturia effusa]|uniref:MYND-type domain-containing protein n=1 Tax=Venturia effusa TaxID=50376 RepID=A0A517LKC2_9PEZI|nr:hypothetical protein FKW77_006109 [Venturia effusa]
MAHPAIPDRVSFFYPIGNTPAVCLTRDIPRELPAKILLLGCGDVRNVLYTCYVDRDASRLMDITCCDIQPAVIARNICLLSLVLETNSIDQSQLIWDIYYHFYIDTTALNLLVEQSQKLVSFASSLESWKNSKYGSLFRFCDSGTFLKVVDIWRGYAVTDKTKQEKFSAKFRSDLNKSAEVKKSAVGSTGFVLSGFRSASPIAFNAMEELPKLHSDYQKYGTTTGRRSNEANPMFGSDGTLHYVMDPLFGFHLAPAYAPLASNSTFRPNAQKIHKTVNVAHLEFQAWTDAFRACAERLVFRFFAGDALCFCQTLQQIGCARGAGTQNIGMPRCFRKQNCYETLQLDCEDYAGKGDGPLQFTVIDTSNLVDHLGSINVIVATSPLLENKAFATLSVEVLVKQEKSQLEIVNHLLGGDCASMALLLGLIPVEYFTKATAVSSVDENLLNAVTNSDIRQGQMLVRISWKRTLSTASPASTPLFFNPSDLACLLYKTYLNMFQHENHTRLLSGGMNRDDLKRSLQSSQSQHYHRGSFANLLLVIKTTVAEGWGHVMDHLLGLLERDRLLMIGSNFLQELWVILHDRGVYDNAGLKSSFNTNLRDDILGSAQWKSPPPSARVILQIARSKLKFFTDIPAAKEGIHVFNCYLLSEDRTWQNNFAVLQFGFGKLTTSGQRGSPDFKISIEEDPQGWEGSSHLLVSFLTPSWMLERGKTIVSLFFQSSPTSLMMFSSALGMQLNIFSTSIADKANVFIMYNEPKSSSANTSGSSMSPLALSIPSNEKATATVKMTAHIDRHTDRIAFLAGHADIVSESVKAALQSGGKVEIEQVSPIHATIVIAGQHRIQVHFPVPVVCSNAKTRIARKSSYVEIIAPILGPTDHDSFSAFMHPMALEDGLPVSLNMSRTNLDGMATVDISQPAKIKWMHTHISLMLSEREKTLRLASLGLHDPPAPDLRVNFKEGLFSMFMHFTGTHDGVRQVEKGRVFAISDPKHGGIHIVVIASALCLDGGNGTIVLDAAAIPWTTTVASKTGPWISSLGERIMNIKVDEEELKLWKTLLPAYAERCRTWSHKKSCEYAKQNSIPLSVDLGETPLCSCGNGVFPANFILAPNTKKELPKWNTMAKYATRIAISPSFSVPMVEEQVGPKLMQHQAAPNKMTNKKDSELEALSKLMGDQDKMRSFMKAMEEKKSAQGTSFNLQAALKKGIEDFSKADQNGRAASKSKPKPFPGAQELGELEALEKAMADLMEKTKDGCSQCGKEKQDSGKALLKCAKCCKTKYCSPECQKADWKEHKKSCGKD